MRLAFSSFLEKFRRITSGDYYLPEVDGLRFISLFWVAVLMHLTNFIHVKLYDYGLISNKYLQGVITEGSHAVSLFFMISGFILALPFARYHLLGERKVSLKKYYIRRLTRLEPPYLAALLLAFLLLVFVTRQYSFNDLLPHLGASSVYMHNVIYNGHSLVLGVAWTLEIEVQFYLLAPLFSLVFLIRPAALRRCILLTAIALLNIYAYQNLWTLPVFLLHFLCYFLGGMLLCDLYCCGWKGPFEHKIFGPVGILVLAGMWLVISTGSQLMFSSKLLLLMLFFYITLWNPVIKKLMSLQVISITGGMCYSFYLLHTLVMSATCRVLEHFPIANKFIGVPVYTVALLVPVIVAGMLFYRYIEQPCMRKDWWKKVWPAKNKNR